MENKDLSNDEVILCEDIVEIKNNYELTLTSKKIVIEKDKKAVEVINLNDIKVYNEKVQIHQNGAEVNIQTINKNIIISFSNILKANKFVRSIVDTVTGTTMTKRSVKKINGAIDTVDDVLGIDTRDTIKNAVEVGVSGSLIGSLLGSKISKKK